MSLYKYKKLENEFLSTISNYPKEKYKGKGIVTMCGSLECYYVGAYVLIKLLKKFNCDLPIEIHKFQHEKDEKWDYIFSKIEGVNLKYHQVKCQETEKKGWSLKPFAILDSSFEEVLFLDSDIVPTKNPEYLFNYQPYIEKGAIFWGDTCSTHVKTKPTAENKSRYAFWHLAEREEINEKEFESGQVLINKEKCWKEINLTCHYNTHANWYYKLFLGDKETFHLAWRKLRKDFVFFDQTTSDNVPGGKYFFQYDYNNELLFQHRSGNKFYLENNYLHPKFEYQDDALNIVEELKQVLKNHQ